MTTHPPAVDVDDIRTRILDARRTYAEARERGDHSTADASLSRLNGLVEEAVAILSPLEHDPLRMVL